MGSFIAVLAMMFAFSQVELSLAHPPAQGGDDPEFEDVAYSSVDGDVTIQSHEASLGANYFASNGTLDGLTVADDGLTIAAGEDGGRYVSEPIASPLDSTSDMVPLWNADLPEGATVALETRVQIDGGEWGEWYPNLVEGFTERGERAGTLIWVGGGQATVQFRVSMQRADDGTAPTLNTLTLVVNNGPTDTDEITAQDTEIAASGCPVRVWRRPCWRCRPILYRPVCCICPGPRCPRPWIPPTPTSTPEPQACTIDLSFDQEAYDTNEPIQSMANVKDANGNALTNATVTGVITKTTGTGNDPTANLTFAHQSEGNYTNTYADTALPATYNFHVTAKPASGDDFAMCMVSESVVVAEQQLPTPTPTITPTQGVTMTPDVTVTVTPTATATTTPEPLQACQITGVYFEQEQYQVGDTINLKLRLADAAGNPLAGANVDVTVRKDVAAQGFDEIPFLDLQGVYEGSFSNTDVAGTYNFSFRASDPTGTRFAPCTFEDSITVIGELITPTVSVTPGTPTPTGTMTPTMTTTPPTATTTPPTMTPTVTTTPPTMTPTVTVTPTQLLNSITFGPRCSEFGEQVVQAINAADLRGIDIQIVFDPSVGQVASITPNPAFFSDPNGVVVRDTIDNTNGLIHFAGTTLGNNLINDDQDLFTINWQNGTGGPSQVRVQNLQLVDDNDVRITVNAGMVDVGYIAADCSNVASGTVVLQGRSDYSGVIVTTTGGQQIETNARGDFFIVGDTVASVSYPGYLSAEASEATGATSTDAQGNSLREVGTIELLAGDVNNDDAINIFDLTYMAGKMNQNDSQADLNQDGLVNIFDLVLAASNYNKQGPLTEWE